MFTQQSPCQLKRSGSTSSNWFRSFKPWKYINQNTQWQREKMQDVKRQHKQGYKKAVSWTQYILFNVLNPNKAQCVNKQWKGSKQKWDLYVGSFKFVIFLPFNLDLQVVVNNIVNTHFIVSKCSGLIPSFEFSVDSLNDCFPSRYFCKHRSRIYC